MFPFFFSSFFLETGQCKGTREESREKRTEMERKRSLLVVLVISRLFWGLTVD